MNPTGDDVIEEVGPAGGHPPTRPGQGRPGRPSMGWTELGVGAGSYLLLIAVTVMGVSAFGVTALSTLPLLVLTGSATLGAAGLALVLRVRSLATIGLRSVSVRWLLIGLGAGLLAWLVNRFVVVGYMWLTGDWSNPQLPMAETAASGGLALAGVLLAGALLVPFAEELLFRGVGYGALRRYGVFVAAVVSSLLFGVAHGVNVVLPAAIVLGLVAALLYERSGSIWPGVVVHAVNNALVFGAAAVLL